MKCSEIRTLLADHIAGALNNEEKAIVSGHLLHCRNCKNEAAFLKAYLSEMNALQKIEAPPDFLDKIHYRLESIRPARKSLIPASWRFQLIGAAGVALVVLTVFTFNLTRPAHMPVPPADNLMSAKDVRGVKQEKSAEKEPAFDLKKAEAAAEYGYKKPAFAPVKDEGEGGDTGIILAVTILAAADETLTTKAEETRSLEPSIPLTAPREEGQTPDALPAGEKEESFRRLYSPDKKSDPEPIHTVKAILDGLNGTVIRKEYAKEKDPLSIIVEIPAANYQTLLLRLQEIGRFSSPAPPLPSGAGETVQLMILFEAAGSK